jgi:predicted GH43/DUF377 family glycosyl hydrolase
MQFKRTLLICLAVVMALFLAAAPILAADDLEKNPNPVVIPTNGWEVNGVGTACVIWDTTIYKMWYAGLNGSMVPAIGYATSDDGINWDKEGSTAVFTGGPTWDDFGVGGPCVIKDESALPIRYKMWYTGLDSNLKPTIGYATSEDGIVWDNPVQVFTAGAGFDGFGVSLPSVIKDGSVYYMWYTGHQSDIYPTAIGLATSNNGTGWTRSLSNPVLTGDELWENEAVFGCSVSRASSGRYTMYYSGYDNLGGVNPRIGMAISDDGVDWTKYIDNPVLTNGMDWDNKGVAAPSVIITDGHTEMWYTGSNASNAFKIGYAQHEMTVVPGSSNLSTALLISGLVVLIGFVTFRSLKKSKS